MEDKINSVLELNEGDCVLITSPLGDLFGHVSVIHQTYRYCISDKDGKLRYDDNRKTIRPQDEGCIGDEKIREIDIIAEVGTFNFTEDKELTTWNVRRIDKTHPKYNKDIAEGGDMMSNMMNMFKGMFGEE